MRGIFSKLMTGSMVAGAALLVSACGGSKTAETTENASMTEMNTSDAMMEGTTNDAMATDAMSTDANAMVDANASTDAMADNAAGNAM
jgi:hypothetical protein